MQIGDAAMVPMPRVSFGTQGLLTLNRIAAEVLHEPWVTMGLEGGRIVLRSRRSIPVRRGKGGVLVAKLTPVGQGRVVLRVGNLVTQYGLPTGHSFAVHPEVRPGVVSFQWPAAPLPE